MPHVEGESLRDRLDREHQLPVDEAVSTDGELRWEPPRLVFATDFIDTPGMSYDVSADGQRLLVVKRTTPVISSRIEIVTNWPALLEAAGPLN